MKSWIAEAADRDDWLAQTNEDPIVPEMEIVDPHHHMWNRDGTAYELGKLWQDTGAGHKVVQTVYIECGSNYYADVGAGFAPVGETAYAAGLAALAARDPSNAQIAGIVAHADLRRENLCDVLDAHALIGGELFKGIRHALAWDDESSAFKIQSRGCAGLAYDTDFRRGLTLLGERGLTYDTWHYHHQNKDFLSLAKAVPGTTLVLDHFGTPLGVGQYAGKRDNIFAAWKDDMSALADCPNVIAKLGGMAMPDNGYGWHALDTPISSSVFMEVQKQWYDYVIERFGPERCMFESNFPVDRASIGYNVLWNGLKKIAAEYPPQVQAQMFAGTARKVYRLPC
jgi:predicted TIM-barrel fold metal-dependent hydrolase